MTPVQAAIKALKEMIEHNDYRIKILEDLEKSWNLDSPHGMIREITSSWEKDSRYLRAVIKVLESKPKKVERKKNDNKRKQKSL